MVVALASAMLLALYFLAMIVLHIAPTGYRLLYNTISDYAVGKWAPLARLTTAGTALAIVLLVAALAAGVGFPPLPPAGCTALLLLAAARLGVALVVTDLSGTRATPRGIAHGVIAGVGFIAAVSAVTSLTRGLGAIPLLPVLAAISFPLLILVGVALLVRRLRPIFGLVERLFLLDVNLWLLVTAAALAVHGTRV